jgi:hypothetical protein
LIIYSNAGRTIDTSGDIWWIGPSFELDWRELKSFPANIYHAFQEYSRYLIRGRGDLYAHAQFRHIKSILLYDEVVAALKDTQINLADRSIFDLAKRCLDARLGFGTAVVRLSSFRRWYLWAVDAGFDGFEPDVASELEEIRIGRSPTGQAVLSHDPDMGPLRNDEFSRLLVGLKSASTSSEVYLANLVATWMFVAFGANERSIRYLNEDDLLRTTLPDGSSIFEIRIPRIKKRTVGPRDQFRTRRLAPEIGILVERLITENKALRDANGWDDTRFDRPLLRATDPIAGVLGSPFERDAYRLQAGTITARVKQFAKTLKLQASGDGAPLKLTPRRLRYTFATRLVQEGASPLEVADALDHSSTDYVMVYFNTRSDVVRWLDKSFALTLAPHAQAFMGVIVGSEKKATRGEDPASRLYHADPKKLLREPVGNCGSFNFCGLFAPIACYTCVSFEPWQDAPHETILEALCADRQRRLERGDDLKIVQMHDTTILAIAEVIRLCSSPQSATPSQCEVP